MKKKLLNLWLLLALCLPAGVSFAQAADQTLATATKMAEVNPDIDFATNKFSLTGKAGLILTTGNTDSFNANLLFDIIYRIKRFENKLSLGGLYTDVYNTQSGSGEGLAAQYLYAIYRLDYYLSQLTTTYAGYGRFTDKIKGVDSAYQFFGGVSHYLLKKPGVPTTVRVAGGYNFTHENRTSPAPNDDVHSLEEAARITHLLTSITELTLDLALMENVEDFSDTRLNSDLALTFKITKVLSLVAGWHVRFDNQPVAGFEKIDMIQDLSLGVTF